MAARAGLDRTIVVWAAVELADAHGLHEVTLATLAEKLGVRTPPSTITWMGLQGCAGR